MDSDKWITVDLGSPTFLPGTAHYLGWLQEGSSSRSEDDRRVAQDIAKACHPGAGTHLPPICTFAVQRLMAKLANN